VWAFGWGLGGALALTPSVQAQLAVAPNASGSAVGTSLPIHTIPLNIPGTYTFPPPPAAFDPETASRGATQAYGLPPMPDKQTHPKAYASWLNAVSIPNRITPVLEKTNLYHLPRQAAPTSAAPPMGAQHQLTETPVQAVTNSLNWSGFSVYNASGPFTIEAVAGAYVVPVARNPFGQCPNNPQYDVWSSYWVGIDGFANNALFQNGVEADGYNDCSGSYQYYAAWIEWIPGPEFRVLNAPVEAGDYIFIENYTTSATTGCFFWANESQQWSSTICTSAGALGGNAITGSSVEWITERPYTGEHAFGFAYLTNYVTVPWWQAYAYNYTSGSPTFYYPGFAPSGTLYLVSAIDDGGGFGAAHLVNAPPVVAEPEHTNPGSALGNLR
jgi:hypothetical protein